MSNSRDFNGKVILVTGSSDGIGAETVIQFSRAGAQVVVTGRKTDKISKVAEECKKASPKGLEPLQVVADVTNTDDCKRLVESTVSKFGQIDVLVNNAAAGIYLKLDDPNYLDNYDRFMNLNLRSVMVVTRLVLPQLEKTKGTIVNVSSVAGIHPFYMGSIYNSSKAALDMWAKSISLELAQKGIRINSVSPAAVKTGFITALGAPEEYANAIYEEQAKIYPLGRVGSPDDISKSILFLASDDSSFITGTNIVLDGGAMNTSALKAAKD